MDEATLEALARAAGLYKVWRDFRSDLVAASRQVDDQRRILAGEPTAVLDRWPPMTVPERHD